MPPVIVVGYDDKEPARRALERAIADATSSRSRLVVVAVLELPLDPTAPRNYGTFDDRLPGPVRLTAPPEIEDALRHARDRVAAESLKAAYVWVAGEPAAEIVEVAKEHGASTIVLGAHHHGLFGRLFGADVAAGVRKAAACDVVVVD